MNPEGGSEGMCRERRKGHELQCVVGNNPGVPSPSFTAWVKPGAILSPWKNGDYSGTTCVPDVPLKLGSRANKRVYFWGHH